ncbi:hypothetical protein HQ393_03930 [Chitinibacter bivalviorum]|uniref:Uncharacterized protein n=1 Tax=Chitinibacter bivalviorum TaxID=2739434 RepID=A0A7H9BGT0_9NEIS|nr:hypothetical protein [Chitinibacter bivalviorum]QLG87466.1 hypothetical protein HQ393_03930 [Chitinibacter bivalviorum]
MEFHITQAGYLFFLDVLLPTLVLASLLGFLIYIVCARLVYDHLRENYHDALPQKMSMAFGDAEDSGGGYIAALWYAARTGSWKRIQCNTWRRMFIATQSIGSITGICVTVLCLSFLFPLKP